MVEEKVKGGKVNVIFLQFGKQRCLWNFRRG